jgi:hypothetical protein
MRLMIFWVKLIPVVVEKLCEYFIVRYYIYEILEQNICCSIVYLSMIEHKYIEAHS